MCYDWREEYTECSHVSRVLVKCPKYYKQQEFPNTFFGRLFYGNVQNKEHCGCLTSHYAEKPYCSACTLMVEHRAQRVRDDALIANRLDFFSLEDDFRRPFKEHRERRKEAARKSLERAERNIQRGKTNDNYGIWIPESDYNPQMSDRKDAHAREAEAVQPVSSSSWWKKLFTFSLFSWKRGKEKESQENKQSPIKSPQDDHHDHVNSIPASDHSKPPQRPAEPARRHDHQQRGDVIKNRAPVPPAPEPPPPPQPRPQLTRSAASNQLQTRQYTPHEPPSLALKPAPTEYPRLRHKRGQVHKICPPRLAAPANVPLPEYQLYLNALRAAPSHSTLSTGSVAQFPGPRPPPKREKGDNAVEESPGSFLRRMVGIGPTTPDSEISDISFACQDSARLTNQGKRPVARK
ncbi:hypothetical protein F4776DRAFT_579918 [Hypoxylon sp. NC0597]|nr:hypothetical protein F4776DRAFT_579918 [Hypoxylon sp. NC0597]